MKNNVVLFFLLIALFFCGNAYSQEESGDVQSNSRFGGAVEFNTFYNDNVFSFSPSDLTTFSNLEKEIAIASTQRKKRLLTEKFSTISRTDDAIYMLKMRLSFSTEFIRQAPTSVRVRAATSLFHHNSVKNYSTFALELRQTFLRKYFISVGYATLPDYYLRNLFYKEYFPTTSIHDHYYEVTLNKKSIPVQIGGNILPRLSLAVGYENELTCYSEKFAERTSQSHILSLESDYTLSRTVKIHLNYDYSRAIADGRDNPDTNIVDISNYAHRVNVGTTIELKRLLKIPLQWNFDLVYEPQIFTSEKKLDKYHIGRKDNFTKVFTELEYNVLRNFKLSFNYIWEQNSTNLPETSDAGSYQTHQVGIGIEYSFRF